MMTSSGRNPRVPADRLDPAGVPAGDYETIAESDGSVHVYEAPHHITFVRAMRQAQIPVRHYAGRFFYRGPAAVTSDRHTADDIMRAAMAAGCGALERDQLGKRRHILYPASTERSRLRR